MAAAAVAWLESLDDDQRARGAWAWPSDDERRRWYYTPTDHGGLPLEDMAPAQQSLAMQVVASGLSRPGYVTVSSIMGLENVLDQVEDWQVDWGRERGRDPGLYYLRVFGDPGGDRPWSWRFGGHHVSLHHLVLDGQVRASTPCFLGADPATSPLLGPAPLRPLGGVEDLARELVGSLDAGRRARAVLTEVAPVDIVGGNRAQVRDGDAVMPLPDIWRGHFSEPRLADRVEAMHRRAEEQAGVGPTDHEAVRLTSRPKGVAGAELAPAQQQLLRELLRLYIGRIPEGLAEQEERRFAGDRLGAVHFAWAGSIEAGRPHYFRLQGPRLLTEYDNTQRGANHAHSVWRDPEGDFGLDVLASPASSARP